MDAKTLREQHPDLVKQIENDAAETALALAEEQKKAEDAKLAKLRETHKAEMAEAVKEAKTEALKEAAKRRADIKALCETAKLPELADSLCEDIAVDLEEARKRIFEELVKRNSAPGTGTPESDKLKDEDAAYRKEFAEGNLAETLNLTEEDYINSRRVDDGKKPHPKKSA